MKEVVLDQSEQATDAFGYKVSHDLRNTARALKELPEWIVEDLEAAGIDLPETVAEQLELMTRYAKRLDKMLLDLSRFSKLGKLDACERIDLSKAVADSVNNSNSSDELSVDFSSVFGTVLLPKEEARLLIANVVDNAVKHGNSRLSISSQRTDGNICLTFEDDGVGPPEGMMDQIFLPMKTGKSRDEVEGTGMGLAIVLKIAEIHGGKVFAGHSETLGGFRLDIYFPEVNNEI